MKQFIILSIMLLPILLLSQEKREKEERVKEQDFPVAALLFLNTDSNDYRRLRYYYETDGERESYEAKFKKDGEWFSVEFNTEGQLQDIEVTTDWEDLPKSFHQSLENYMQSNYERWKFEKFQRQFLPQENNTDLLKSVLSNPLTVSPFNIELIVATKNDGKLQKFELLFTSEGQFLQKRKVIRRSYGFLLF